MAFKYVLELFWDNFRRPKKSCLYVTHLSTHFFEDQIGPETFKMLRTQVS